MPLTIYIDSDACPGPCAQLLVQIAPKRDTPLVFVANRRIVVPSDPLIKTVRVSGSFDAADDYIAEQVTVGDLVITADIPLAARVVAAGSMVVTPRGDVIDESNVGERVATRNLLQDLRGAGEIQGGPAAYGPHAKKRFADAIDRILARAHKKTA